MKEQQKLKRYQNNHTFAYRYLRKLQHPGIVSLSHSLWRAVSDLLPATGSPWTVVICPEALTLAVSDA